MSSTSEHQQSVEARIRDWMPALFLIDVGLMFSGIFVANASAWWIWLPFHIASCTYTIFVLYLAQIASRYVPNSIPLQRPLGILLYLSCHVVQFFGPTQIQMALIGYLMFAAPIALIFMFDHLLEDSDDTPNNE